MTARWMVDRYRPRARAHLYRSQTYPLEKYGAKVCEMVGIPLWALDPDDGRPRCKRCLAAERRALDGRKEEGK